jgi:ribosomal-protein-alanine N-acetyltransferase
MNRDAAYAALNDITGHPWTAGYVLRPVSEADADELLAHFGNPAVTEFLDIDDFASPADVERLLAWAGSILEAGTGVRWTIRDQDADSYDGAAVEQGAFVGTCGFHRLDYSQGCKGQIGYDLTPEKWGQGVMAEVLPAMLEFAFGPLGLHRIEAMVTPGNDRSCRLLEKHGFRREGLLRHYAFWRGAWQDQILFARLASDG